MTSSIQVKNTNIQYKHTSTKQFIELKYTNTPQKVENVQKTNQFSAEIANDIKNVKIVKTLKYKLTTIYNSTNNLSNNIPVQCFDTVGWAAGRASGL